MAEYESCSKCHLVREIGRTFYQEGPCMWGGHCDWRPCKAGKDSDDVKTLKGKDAPWRSTEELTLPMLLRRELQLMAITIEREFVKHGTTTRQDHQLMMLSAELRKVGQKLLGVLLTSE